MTLHESGEMYLETILVLSQTQEYVRSLDIAEHMGFSKPSVSRAVGKLKSDGFITVDGENHISLSKSGEAVAKKIYERHIVLSQFLESLGVNSEIAAEDACRMEHVVSDESLAAIKKALSKKRD